MAAPQSKAAKLFSKFSTIDTLDRFSFNALTMNPGIFIRYRAKRERERRKETLGLSRVVVSSDIDLAQAIQHMEGNSCFLPFPYFTAAADFLFLKHPEKQNNHFPNMHEVCISCLLPLEQG